VVGNVINGSYWSTLLQTDTTASSLVNGKVRFFSLLGTFGIIFLAVVSVVTPLGLYNNLAQTSFEEIEFKYAADPTPMGIGTPPRDGYQFGRTCETTTYFLNCPGQEHGWDFYLNGTERYVQNLTADPYISTLIPSNITKIFSSGQTGDRRTLAGAFDIQYRTFILEADKRPNSTLFTDPSRIPFNYDQYRTRTKGKYHNFQSYILNDQFDAVEGLIVNSKTGGIGFRNHTIPISPGQGAEWTEGILWMEPETVCVASNISLDFEIGTSGFGASNVVLTDRGGFVNLQQTYPRVNLNDTQNNPGLYGRARKGAILNNYNLMTFLNSSRNRSSIGKRYMLPTGGAILLRPDKLALTAFSSTSGYAQPVIPGYSLNLPYRPSNASNTYVETGEQ